MDLWKDSTVPESELNPLTILTHESDQQNPSEFDIDQLVKEGGCARRDLPIPGLDQNISKIGPNSNGKYTYEK